MNGFDDIIQLAKILEIESSGGSIDRVRARELASTLLTKYPEIRHTLTRIRDRMAH